MQIIAITFCEVYHIHTKKGMIMRTFIHVLLCCFLLLVLRANSQTPPISRDSLFKVVEGKWVQTLSCGGHLPGCIPITDGSYVLFKKNVGMSDSLFMTTSYGAFADSVAPTYRISKISTVYHWYMVE